MMRCKRSASFSVLSFSRSRSTINGRLNGLGAFSSKTVEIFRRGDEVVLREKPRTMGDILAKLPPLTAEDEAGLDEMLRIINEPQLPDREREFFWPEDDSETDPKTMQSPPQK